MKKALWLLLLFTGAAHAQFQARDFNGDGAVDAFYDVAQNLTWLADANYYATQGGVSGLNGWGQQMLPGQMLYTTALSFVDSLSVYGVDDWRLPARIFPTVLDPFRCSPELNSCVARLDVPSELSILAAELGGTSGPFLNVMPGTFGYMTSAGFNNGGGSGGAPVMEIRDMFANTKLYTDEVQLAYGYVWAVRDGDISGAVAPIPEPGTWALMVAGLLGLGAHVRRRTA